MISIILSIVSSTLLVLSFPNFDYSVLAWIGLVPLLVSLHGKGALKGFFLSLLCGALFWAGLVYWLMNVPKYTLLHYVILMPYLGLFFGLFGALHAIVSRHWGILPAHVAAPFFWIALDLIRSHFFWLELPWGMLAHSQHENLFVIQIASFTGAYGVSFLVMAVNSVVALAIITFGWRLTVPPKTQINLPSSKTVITIASSTAAMVVMCLIFGAVRISRPVTGDSIKIALVQGNIPQDQKWDRKYASFIMETYSDLTLKAAEHRPALIAWPETATPGALNHDAYVMRRVNQVVQEARAPLLIGSAQRRKYEEEGKKSHDYTNAAYLLTLDGYKIRNQRYNKIHLLPFGEYLPAQKSIPWHYLNIDAVGGYKPGSEFTVFEMPPYRLSAPICWENIFPNDTRQFVKAGAQFIVNITNAAYFGRTAAPYQVLSMNVFRAVENRVYVARAANIGISCIIDPYGRVVDRVRDEKGDDIMVRGYLTGTIKPQSPKTFYTLYGDVFAWICSVGAAAFFLILLFRAMNQQT